MGHIKNTKNSKNDKSNCYKVCKKHICTKHNPRPQILNYTKCTQKSHGQKTAKNGQKTQKQQKTAKNTCFFVFFGILAIYAWGPYGEHEHENMLSCI